MNRDESGIAVVMPTLNRSSAACAKVRWLLTQRDVRSVIVVDDASTDDTAWALREIDDPRVRVIQNSSRLGTPGSRNQGLRHVDQTWVAILDDDDEHSEDYLATLRDIAIQEQADIVGASWHNLKPSTGPWEAFCSAERSPRGPVLGRPDLVPTASFVSTLWIPANYVISRDVLSAGVRFDEQLRYNFWREETAFVVDAARNGFRVGSTNECYSFLRSRIGGGNDRRSFSYELWTLRNDIRFIRDRGAWLKSQGWIESSIGFVLDGVRARVASRVVPPMKNLLATLNLAGRR